MTAPSLTPPVNTELRGFTDYGRRASSPVLFWLPLFAGFVVAAVTASLNCPVPRTQLISGLQALSISAFYVAAILTAGAGALMASGYAVVRSRFTADFSRLLLRFGGVTVWLAVNSSLRRQSNDARPPIEDVLTFRVPAQSAIREFDEVIIRFQLSSPRRSWSAKIAIDRFRLIPRGL